MRGIKSGVAAAGLALTLACGAQAADLYSFAGPTGVKPTDTSFSADFDAAAGAGLVTFTLDGYLSLDGDNGWWEDDFVLSHNSAPIVRGTFNLGGGGGDHVFFAPVGSAISNISGNGFSTTWNGGKVTFSVPLALTAGMNNLTWTYLALPNPDHAGFQGTGDEGWGLEAVNVSGAAGVPEPMIWMTMIAGFGLAGAALRRRARATA